VQCTEETNPKLANGQQPLWGRNTAHTAQTQMEGKMQAHLLRTIHELMCSGREGQGMGGQMEWGSFFPFSFFAQTYVCLVSAWSYGPVLCGR
jgi:hypothetical protein